MQRAGAPSEPTSSSEQPTLQTAVQTAASRSQGCENAARRGAVRADQQQRQAGQVVGAGGGSCEVQALHDNGALGKGGE